MTEHDDDRPSQKPIQPYVPLHQPPKTGGPSRRDKETAEDREMEKALGPRSGEPAPAPPQINLKRQWDDDLQAELDAAMAGFDAHSLDVPRAGRSRAEDRAHVPQEGRGQEERPGIQQARVLSVKGEDIFLDLGAKSEGVVPTGQFVDEGEPVPQPGEMIEVVFERFDPEEGLLRMSRRGAAVEARWENLHKGAIVEARGTKVIKGGMEVDVSGIRAFMPISQIDLARVEDAAPFVNEKFKAVVTEANRLQKNLVVSRREYLQREREALKAKTWAELEEGQVRKGVIRSIQGFGAFVDLGGVDGLIHISDMSWSRTTSVGDLLKLGDEVEVKVLKIDREAQKVGLGLKQLAPSPWDTIEDRLERGMTVRGKVTRLMDFGAFVELEPGIEGLIHVSEIANNRVYRVKDHVQEGQEVEVRVLDVNPETRRISLSLKPLAGVPAAEPEPEEDDDAPPAPKPERKVPLRGGLGDRDKNPFGG